MIFRKEQLDGRTGATTDGRISVERRLCRHYIIPIKTRHLDLESQGIRERKKYVFYAFIEEV